VTVKLWIDVEDLFAYSRSNPRPSGIQRLAFEIYKILHAHPNAAEFVRFVRHETSRNTFRVVRWADIEACFLDLSQAVPAPISPPPSEILPHAPARQFVRKLVHRLPPSLRAHVIAVMLTSSGAAHAWMGLIDALARGAFLRIMRPLRRFGAFNRGAGGAKKANAPIRNTPHPECQDVFGHDSAPGDILLALGSPWSHPDYATLIRVQRARGLKFVLLVYDLIPLRRPEWCNRGLVRVFRTWFDNVLPLCDRIFAISQATAADVELYARQQDAKIPTPVVPIPIGTSFFETRANAAIRTQQLPAPGSYALIVSTIEARKNHQLLFRVWRRMLDEMPARSVPTLVFAGRVGWLVDDLMRQIANTNNLNGKLVLIENPTDTDLRALYEGCQFSMFPSFFEGWGLPITESLALGKPCLTSDRTSLPEAGGKLARRFDPDNLHDAYRAIREVIDDPAGLARWEAQVRREFKPVPWSATADALLSALDHPMAPAEEENDISPLIRTGVGTR
jgi:glycosyltransferase involved in cell wall biosynthesis